MFEIRVVSEQGGRHVLIPCYYETGTLVSCETTCEKMLGSCESELMCVVRFKCLFVS